MRGLTNSNRDQPAPADAIVRLEEVGLGSLSAPRLRDRGTQRLAGIACLAVTVCGWALNWSSIKVLLQVWPPLFSRGLAGIAASAAFDLTP